MNEDLTVLLLAGGKSTRFWPLPNKMTLSFLGSTLLEYQIEQLRSAGLNNLVVVVSEEIAGRISQEKIKVVIQKGEGMGSAVLSAAEYIKNKPFLMVIGDDLVDRSLFRDLTESIKLGSRNLLVGYKTPSYFPGGYLKLNGKQVEKIQEKPGEGNEPSEYVYISSNYITDGSQYIKYIEKAKNRDPLTAYEDGLSLMIADGHIFEMVEYTNDWVTLKYPWYTLLAMEYFLKTIKESKISKTTSIHQTASIVGPVVLEDGVHVMEYAKLVGPLYVGAGTIIGNHTIVRYSMIGENCVVGYGSDVTRSYIGDNCWFHSNYIGDSVLSHDIGIGAGATLANLRLDEGHVYSVVKGEKVDTQRDKFGAVLGSGARIGVGAQVMPGVKVGKNSAVGPGVILQEDLIDNQLCYVKQVHTIVKNSAANIKDRTRFRKKI